MLGNPPETRGCHEVESRDISQSLCHPCSHWEGGIGGQISPSTCLRRRPPSCPKKIADGDWSMRRHRDVGNELGCFKSGWCELELRNFDHWQWTTLSPFFALSKERKEVNHYRLQDQIIFPFMDEATWGDESKPATIELLGGGGRVFKIRIHPEHHSFHGLLQVTLPPSPYLATEWHERSD